MEMLADEADFKDFAQKVMARVTPERPPLLERWSLSLNELFTYHRSAMLSSAVTAALVLAIGLPLLLRDRVAHGYASPQMAVEIVTTDEGAHVAPVVMESENGNAIIWLVNHPDHAQDSDEAAREELELEPKAPEGGEL
jgi:hypothetical protein